MAQIHPLNDIRLNEVERVDILSFWTSETGRKVHKFLLVNRPTPARGATLEEQALAGREAIGYDLCLYVMLTLGMPEVKADEEQDDNLVAKSGSR